MTVDLIHPTRVHRVDVHHQVSIASGSRIVSLAGQVGWDLDGRLADGGLAAQAEQSYLNVAAALEAAGAGIGDVTRFTVYVVGLDAERGDLVMAGRRRAEERLGVQLQQPSTYIGVSSLFSPEFFVEIEATAVI